MNAIGEQTLPWFAAEKASAQSVTADLSTLVREHSALLYRIAYSVVRNSAEAEDIVQDVFLRVLQRQPELATIAAIRPWLIRIAWNFALDRCRKVRPDQIDDAFAASLISATAAPDQAVAQAIHLRKVLDAMDALPNRERQTLILSAIEELSTAEIGSVLGKSESTVRSLLFRARNRLRERLEE